MGPDDGVEELMSREDADRLSPSSSSSSDDDDRECDDDREPMVKEGESWGGGGGGERECKEDDRSDDDGRVLWGGLDTLSTERRRDRESGRAVMDERDEECVGVGDGGQPKEDDRSVYVCTYMSRGVVVDE